MKPFNIFKAIVVILVLFVFSSCKDQEKKDHNAVTITVTGGEHFPKGTNVSLFRFNVGESFGGIETLKTATFINNTFQYKAIVNDPHNVILRITPEDNSRQLSKIILALEPGDITIDYLSKNQFKLKGGKFNELVVNSWNDNPKYIKASAKLTSIKKIFDTLRVSDKAIQKKYRKQYSIARKHAEEVKNEAFKQSFKETEDPLLKLMAYAAGYYGENGKEVRENNMENLALNLKKSRQSQFMLKVIEQSRKKRLAESESEVGKVMKDFETKNIDGEVVSLSKVLKKNKYVLVEFWASWCKPCRAEIPHMKKAYAQYKNKGFEILSFSIDDKRKLWEKASKEEQLPWINAGDLKATESPVALMFGITTLPTNFLIDASTNKIINKDLRNKKLDNKLSELLGK